MTVIISDNLHGVLIADKGVFRNGLVQPIIKIFNINFNGHLALAAFSGSLLHRGKLISAFVNKQPAKDTGDSSLHILGVTEKMQSIYQSELYGCTSNALFTSYIFDERGLCLNDAPICSNYDVAEYIATGKPNLPNRSILTMQELHDREVDYVGYGFDVARLFVHKDSVSMAQHGLQYDRRYHDKESKENITLICSHDDFFLSK